MKAKLSANNNTIKRLDED